jgi:hypothetical protein
VLASAAEPVRWIAQGDGFWDVTANWSGGVVPGAADDVIIDVPRNPRVARRTGDDRVHSLVSRNLLVLEGGTLSLGTSSSIAKLASE